MANNFDDPFRKRLVSLGTGTYVLWFVLTEPVMLTVGRLGPRRFARGSYGYVGSAFGPGGLAARIGHHLRGAGRVHWHLDYLRSHVTAREVWCSAAAVELEHRWARTLAAMRGATAPAAGFGATDCSCPTHLFAFPRIPRVASFRKRLRTDSRQPPSVHRLVVRRPCQARDA